MARRGGRRGGRGSRPPTNRHYPRTARLNALLREIVADAVERIDDDDLGLVTVTGVEVDNDLNRAQVFVSTLDHDPVAEPDPAADRRLLDTLAEHRTDVQAAIAGQARLRKTPEVVFAIDPAVRSGARIEHVLRTLDDTDDGDDGDDGDDDR